MHFDNYWAWPLLDYMEMLNDFGNAGRGIAYALNTRIIKMAPNGLKGVTAHVQGHAQRVYKTQLFLIDTEEDYGALSGAHARAQDVFYVDSSCSCPVGTHCKHSYAVALTLLYAGYSKGSRVLRDETEWMPDDWRNGECLPPDSIFAGLEHLFRPGPEDEEPLAPPAGATGKDKPAQKKPEAPWWELFVWEEDVARRLRILTQGMEKRVKTSRWTWWPVETTIRYLNALPNRIEALRNIGKALERVKGMDPATRIFPAEPELEAYLASEEAAVLHARFEEARARDALSRWLQPAPEIRNAAPACEVEIVWTSLRDIDQELPCLAWRMLLTTQKLKRAPRKPSGMMQLLHDIEGGRRRLPAEQARLVEWISHLASVSPVGGSEFEPGSDETVIPVFDAILWLNLWAGRGMLNWEDGGKIEFPFAAARLVLRPETEGRLSWAVRFPEAAPEDSGDVPLKGQTLLAEANAFRPDTQDPRVYLRRGNRLYRLETGGMPPALLGLMARMDEVPREALRGPGAGEALLRRLGLHTSTDGDIPGLLRLVPVKPVLEFHLEEDDRITVVARAEGETGERFVRDTGGAWNWASPQTEEVRTNRQDQWEGKSLLGDFNNQSVVISEARLLPEEPPAVEQPSALNAPPAATRPPAALCVLPRPEDTSEADRFLADMLPADAVGETTEQGLPALGWKITPKNIDRFLSAWAARPAHAQYLGNRPFYNMVTLQRAPGFRVRVESSGVDWLEVSLEAENEMRALGLDEVRQALASGSGALIALSGKRLFRREDLEEYQRTAETLMEMGLDIGGGTGRQRLHAIQLAGLKQNALMELSSDTRLKDLASRARKLLEDFRGVPAAPIHPQTAAHLRPYQRQGADFTVWACHAFGGAVLADDMGLGKTLQVIAALTALRARMDTPPAPSLVICPASVAHNWQREVRRFAPMLRTAVLERGTQRKEILGHAQQYDLIVLNYALARRDAALLEKHEWLLVCVDEAQAIKNPDSATALTLKRLRAAFRIALTGTPVENKLLDLWSILDFTAPGVLPGRRAFEQNVRSGDPSLLFRVLRAKLRPLLIRRLKTEVAPELPPRIEERRDCEMTPAQRKSYLAELQRARDMLKASRDKKMTGKDRFQMLAVLTRLRQICCDPALVGIDGCGSGKTDTMMEIVEELLEAGHKTLIFSQFVRMLERLKDTMKKKHIPHRMLTGETRDRRELVDAFENDPEPGVFLISLKAGGTGLNLVSASYVILFDPWWNPAVEAQAIDRAHRIGQDKTVVAYRLVTEDTVEERILALQEKKRGLAGNILEEEAFNRALTREDFEYLLLAEHEETAPKQ